jgi:ADP-heptose:LPS heptosyltransferase
MRVLIYHRLNIGDLVLASPALQVFLRKNPAADVRVVTNDLAGLVAPWLPGVTSVDTYGRYGKGKGEWNALLRARRWRPDLAIALSPSPDRKLALRFMAIANGIGFATDEFLYRMAYASRVQVPQAAMHVAESLGLLFGLDDVKQLPGVRLDSDAVARCDYEVWLHAGARKPSNRPSAAQLIEIVNGILDAAPGSRIAITSVLSSVNPAHPSDEPVMAEIRSHFRGRDAVSMLSPGLAGTIEVIHRSKSAITPDGGLMHVAAAFGKPVVGLMGNTSVEHWRPFSPIARWIQAPSKLVSEIKSSEVLRIWSEIALPYRPGSATACA